MSINFLIFILKILIIRYLLIVKIIIFKIVMISIWIGFVFFRRVLKEIRIVIVLKFVLIMLREGRKNILKVIVYLK